LYEPGTLFLCAHNGAAADRTRCLNEGAGAGFKRPVFIYCLACCG
jgi:hypothetical protein